MEDKQVFSEYEIKALSEIEAKLVEEAKHGGMVALTAFCKAKRSVMDDRDAALARRALIDINTKRI